MYIIDRYTDKRVSGKVTPMGLNREIRIPKGGQLGIKTFRHFIKSKFIEIKYKMNI